MMVAVQPRGWLRKNTGAMVWTVPSLWWSMISMISALSMPATAWLFSLWSTRITCLPLAPSRFLREIMPRYLPSLSRMGKSRCRLLAMTSRISSV